MCPNRFPMPTNSETSRSSSFGSIQDFRRLLLAHWCCHYEGEKFPKSKTGQENSQEKHQPIIVQDAYFATDLSNLKTASSHISFAIKSHQKNLVAQRPFRAGHSKPRWPPAITGGSCRMVQSTILYSIVPVPRLPRYLSLYCRSPHSLAQSLAERTIEQGGDIVGP